MTLTIYNYQIKQDGYGWVAQKRVGNQWKDNSYFSALEQAVEYVFNQQLARTTKHEKIDLIDIQRAKLQVDRIIERMDSICEEIIGVLR